MCTRDNIDFDYWNLSFWRGIVNQMEFLSLETSTIEKTEISQLISLVCPDGTFSCWNHAFRGFSLSFGSPILLKPVDWMRSCIIFWAIRWRVCELMVSWWRSQNNLVWFSNWYYGIATLAPSHLRFDWRYLTCINSKPHL